MAILAPLKSPQTIGELVCILFDAIEKQRGPHWHVDQAAVTAAIGGPIHAWIDDLGTKESRLAEKLAGPAAIGIGLFSVFFPIAIGEWALYQERKNAANPAPSPQQQPGPYAASSPSYGGHQDRPAAGEVYGAALGFGPVADAPHDQANEAGIGLMAGRLGD